MSKGAQRGWAAQHDVVNLPPCDVLFADLGVSSPHFDDPARGFSFRSDGPLDCRYDRSKGKTAADLLNAMREEELLHVFRDYGELRGAEKLVQAVLDERKQRPLKTTQDIVGLVQHVYGWRTPKLLPQVFQALRIAVNDELSALQVLLQHGPSLLKTGGRMGILSYHSLEDRLAKERFRGLTTAPKHPVTGTDLSPAPFRPLTKGAVKATLREVEENPRARSCRFRAVQKVL